MFLPTQTTTYATLDGLNLHVNHWASPTPARAVVLLVHGYAEHTLRLHYQQLARHFSEKGLVVIAHDQRGHGQSEGPRANVQRFEQLVEDLKGIHRQVVEAHPGLPVFLLGHSMGGAVACLYVLKHRPDLRGLLLSSAMLQLDEGLSPVLQAFAPLVGALLPSLPTTKLSSQGLSHDPEVVRAYDEDPLIYRGGVPARMGAEMIRAIKKIQANKYQLEVPLLMVHGTEDRLTNPQGSEAVYEAAASRDKTLKLYEGMRHELLNESVQEAVRELVSNWIVERLT